MAIPPPIELSSLGMADSLILMILALVVFGPRKLPQIGRQIGKLMYEFRKASNDFKFQMEEELRMSEEAERKQKEEAQRQQALTGQAAVSAPASLPAETLPGETLPTEALQDPTVEKMPEVQPPRMSGPVIQPPSTGEIVPIAKPDAPKPAAEAHVGAEGPAQTSSTETSSETVSQHG